jgi:hypothetical protein
MQALRSRRVSSILMLLHLCLLFFGIGFVDQPRNQWFSGEPPKTRELSVASANHHS